MKALFALFGHYHADRLQRMHARGEWQRERLMMAQLSGQLSHPMKHSTRPSATQATLTSESFDLIKLVARLPSTGLCAVRGCSVHGIIPGLRQFYINNRKKFEDKF